jgi:hypothetical protein
MTKNMIIATRTVNSQIHSFFEVIFSRIIFIAITPISSPDYLGSEYWWFGYPRFTLADFNCQAKSLACQKPPIH